jgi:hypothetical protein
MQGVQASHSRQAANLRANDQEAWAGLVEGKRDTGKPKARVSGACLKLSPPLWAMATKAGQRTRKLSRSLGWAF